MFHTEGAVATACALVAQQALQDVIRSLATNTPWKIKQAMTSVEVWLKRAPEAQFNGLITDILPVLLRAWHRGLKASGDSASQSSPLSSERAEPVVAGAVARAPPLEHKMFALRPDGLAYSLDDASEEN